MSSVALGLHALDTLVQEIPRPKEREAFTGCHSSVGLQRFTHGLLNEYRLLSHPTLDRLSVSKGLIHVRQRITGYSRAACRYNKFVPTSDYIHMYSPVEEGGIDWHMCPVLSLVINMKPAGQSVTDLKTWRQCFARLSRLFCLPRYSPSIKYIYIYIPSVNRLIPWVS